MFARKKQIAVLAVALLGLAIITGCSKGDSADKVLRIATPSLGDKELPVWEAAKASYEAAHEGWTVEFIQQDDDLYSTYVHQQTACEAAHNPMTLTQSFFHGSTQRLSYDHCHHQ